MNAKEISSKKFDVGFRGYETAEVDSFLKEMSSEFASLQKENKELDKKIEVLADKIREYRNDEDALKEALLGAQKLGAEAISEAKAKAKKIVEDAKTEAEDIINKANEKKDKKAEECDKLVADTEAEKERILEDAENKRKQMELEMNSKVDMYKETIYRLKSESDEYSSKLISMYKSQIEVIESIPHECENEYTTKLYNEQKTLRNVTLKKSSVQKPEVKKEKKLVIEEKAEKPAKTEETAEDAAVTLGELINSDADLDKTSELKFSPIFEEDMDDENVDEFLVQGDYDDDNNENEIFFKKHNKKNDGNKEKLQFGNNTVLKKK